MGFNSGFKGLISIFRKYDEEVWKGLLRLRIGTDS